MGEASAAAEPIIKLTHYPNMRSRLTLTIAVLVAAVLAAALFIVADSFPIWVALVLVLVLAALATIVASKPVADVSYTFLAGVGGGVIAAIAFVFFAITAESGILAFTLAAVAAIGAGILSGRRQHRYRRDSRGVATSAVASTLIAGVLAAAVLLVAFLAYALISCSHFVNNCPFD